MKKNQKKNLQPETQTPDSGRSMVEMLGTLAVIGVLSITGIVGYKYAMNRYRVNQIANELNMLSNQIFLTMSLPHTGEYELSLGGGYDEGSITTAPYAFDFGCGNDMTVETPCTDSEPDYFLSLESVPTEIRLPLVQMMEQVPNVTSVTENEELLAFVFTRDEVGIDDDFIETFFDEVITTSLTKPITTIITTIGQECQIDSERDCCSNIDCIKNDGKTYYCYAYSNSSSIEAVYKSECKEAKVKTKPNDVEWYMSEDPMTWWTAQRFCEAINASTMISVQDLNCKDISTGACYDITNGNEKSFVLQNLYDVYGGHSGWTSDVCANSSYVYTFSTYENGHIEERTRDNNGRSFRAVCK